MGEVGTLDHAMEVWMPGAGLVVAADLDDGNAAIDVVLPCSALAESAEACSEVLELLAEGLFRMAEGEREEPPVSSGVWLECGLEAIPSRSGEFGSACRAEAELAGFRGDAESTARGLALQPGVGAAGAEAFGLGLREVEFIEDVEECSASGGVLAEAELLL